MKIILLIDADPARFRRIVNIVAKNNNKEPLSFISGKGDEVKDYNGLYNVIERFSHLNEDIIIINYSGEEEVVQSLGDERSEMIISLSYNKKSRYYVENLEKMVLDLLQVFNVVKTDELQTA